MTREIVKLLTKLEAKHRLYDIFFDWVKMMGYSIESLTSVSKYQAIQEKYLDISKKYNADDLEKMAEAFARLRLLIKEEPNDYLGFLFHELRLHDTAKGQFFSPYILSKIMADEVLTEEFISAHPIIRVNESAVGAGAMVIAQAHRLKELGHDYSSILDVVIQDIDLNTLMMAYVQLSLLNVSATGILGDALSLECRDVMETPRRALHVQID